VPLGVNCQTPPLAANVVIDLDSADSIRRASTNRWQTDRAISFCIEKVVVVVVTTHLDVFCGSGMRFDCENFSEPRLVIASSVKNVSSIRENRTLCGVNGKLVISVANRSWKSLVKGRSSSVVRRVLDDVWCILPSFLSELGIVGFNVAVLFLDS
jgi:hypothetical protein